MARIEYFSVVEGSFLFRGLEFCSVLFQGLVRLSEDVAVFLFCRHLPPWKFLNTSDSFASGLCLYQPANEIKVPNIVIWRIHTLLENSYLQVFTHWICFIQPYTQLNIVCFPLDQELVAFDLLNYRAMKVISRLLFQSCTRSDDFTYKYKLDECALLQAWGMSRTFQSSNSEYFKST